MQEKNLNRFAFTGRKITMLASCKNAKTKPQFKQKKLQKKSKRKKQLYMQILQYHH